MTPDENLGLWLIIIGVLWWLFGVASFGVTGGHMVTVLIANSGIFLAPIATIIGVVLLVRRGKKKN